MEEEAYPGLSNELMIGYLAPGVNYLISPLSIGVLVDFNYKEVNPGASEGIPTKVSNFINLNPIRLNCNHHFEKIRRVATIDKTTNSIIKKYF